jgi:hypothetical protein
MSKKTRRETVDIDNVEIEPPTVDIGDDAAKPDAVHISITPYEYRTKKFELIEKSGELKNCVVAYKRMVFSKRDIYSDDYNTYNVDDALMDEKIYAVERCIDCFHSDDQTFQKSVNKAVAASIASRNACVLFTDEDNNVYVCKLNSNFWYEDVRTQDVLSSKYGGLTYLETRGKSQFPSPKDKDRFFKVLSLVSADGFLLVPVKDMEDFIPRNAYYCLTGVKPGQSDDLAVALIYSVKSQELEKHVTGVYYKGESD